MKSERLNTGFWFIGDETYMNLSFWDGYDQQRKIHRIGFAIDFKGKKEVYLNLSAKDNIEEATFLKTVANEIGAKAKYDDLNQKIYGSNINSSKDFIRLLDEFIDEDKPLLDRILIKSPTVKHITLKRFNKNIERINSVRSELGLKLSTLTKPIEAKKRMRGRGGVTSRNVQQHIRERIAQKIKVNSIHNQIQNQLYNKLDRENSNEKLIMEENWIDLLQISDGKTFLYEVKPYSSATRCIREGIGQLLHYCSQQFEETNNVVFVIVGPNNMDNDDHDYLRFVKESIKIEIEYLQIEIKDAGI